MHRLEPGSAEAGDGRRSPAEPRLDAESGEGLRIGCLKRQKGIPDYQRSMTACSRLDLLACGHRLRKYSDRAGVFVVAAVLIFEAAALYLGLGYHDDFYDAGVYLQSARMMLRGYHLYGTIFDSQPPLWLPLIYCSFRLFGPNLFAAQSVVAAMGVIATLAAALATRQLAGWGAAALTAAAIAFSPLELRLSATISPEIPTIALGTAAMAFAIRYVRQGSRISFCLAAILVTCSILVKLLGLFTLPALILMFGARHWNAAGISRSQKGKRLLTDALFVFGIATILTIGFLFEFGPANVWQQAVEFHWSARSALEADSIPHQATIVASVIAGDGLLAALTLFGVLSILVGLEGTALVGWILFAAVGLLYQQPLFIHHLVILIPPIAIAGGVGWNLIPKIAERLRNRRDGAVTGHIIGVLAVLVDLTVILLLLSTCGFRIAAEIANPRPPVPLSHIAAAQMIQRQTTPPSHKSRIAAIPASDSVQSERRLGCAVRSPGMRRGRGDAQACGHLALAQTRALAARSHACSREIGVSVLFP